MVLTGSWSQCGVKTGYGCVVSTSVSSAWSKTLQGPSGDRPCMPETTGCARSSARMALTIGAVQA